MMQVIRLTREASAMDQSRAIEEDGAPRVKIDKQDFVEAFREADEAVHGIWRLEKAIPITSLGGVILVIITGAIWYQSVNDKIASIQSAEQHDAANIDIQTATFGKIAADSTTINVRLTTVETKLNDVIDGIKRIEDRQGGDPPGK